ncbi:hypothetical protein AVEN_130410-1 [Araneus ventricosus]|uniref:Uncharacterized protein n=1 Tax=Araneus ventricosus TaxID=182803 RepID=A0A4Y2BDH6_ARAVE|nr:hypothetical protein AVEN_130410-1 [Araneus ventricosus]
MCAKETLNVIKAEVKRIKEQVISSLLTKININDMKVSVKPTLIFCMIDAEICNAVARCESTQNCYLCDAKQNLRARPKTKREKISNEVRELLEIRALAPIDQNAILSESSDIEESESDLEESD